VSCSICSIFFHYLLLDECDWTLKSTFMWGSCEIIHPSINPIFWVWLDFRVATCFYMKHAHFWLVYLTFGDDLLKKIHHHLSSSSVVFWLKIFVRSSNFSHGRVTNYEWMIENKVKRICNSHGVIRKSSQEVLVQGFGDEEFDMFACERVAFKLIFSMNVYNSTLTYLNHVNCE
jgi:hypothetical protein